jgi:CYTH domain-containing protein
MTAFSSQIDKTLKYAKVEEERRFLLKVIPNDLNLDASFQLIIDRYISGTRLRLRRIESPLGQILEFKLGQKYQAPDQEAHQTIMTNIFLNEAEYKIFENLAGAKLIKRRYPYHHGGCDYSIDVFDGHLKGLILAEIESQNKFDISLLLIPTFSDREVTDDPFFTGRRLAALTKVEFQKWLATQ